MSKHRKKWQSLVSKLIEEDSAIPDEVRDSPSRRLQPRVPISLRVEMKFEGSEDIVSNKSLDLSPTGVFIRTREARNPGTPVRLRLSFRTKKTVVEGVVKHHVPVDDATMDIPGIGVEFTEVSEEARAFIEDVLGMHSAVLR